MSLVLTCHGAYLTVTICTDCPSRAFRAAQVLDLGVTRTLVHRLLRVFPHICKNHVPLCGSIAATCRIANMRLLFLGRRNKAPSISPG